MTEGEGMSENRATMKEVKIRLEEADHLQLAGAAKRSLRSINAQVTYYVRQGLRAEKRSAVGFGTEPWFPRST